mmetsp:Transcript_15758/g.25758  ORF Transcript_15758/g.25758 Transcript_15758/m.25758 type:complete len:94 (+) Transcript_15758:4056-4337(+)
MIFPDLESLIEAFSLDRISKRGAIVDTDLMHWISELGLKIQLVEGYYSISSRFAIYESTTKESLQQYQKNHKFAETCVFIKQSLPKQNQIQKL